jgi:hypothetical protein
MTARIFVDTSASELMRQAHEEMIALHRRMKPEERLVAYFYHSQLVYQLYRAGATYRMRSPSSSTAQDNRQQR